MIKLTFSYLVVYSKVIQLFQENAEILLYSTHLIFYLNNF